MNSYSYASYLDCDYRPADFAGNFVELQVSGTVPPGLKGALVGSGRNPLRSRPDVYPFAGRGMVHCLEFAERGVTYENHSASTPTSLETRGTVDFEGPARLRRSHCRTSYRRVSTANGYLGLLSV